MVRLGINLSKIIFSITVILILNFSFSIESSNLEAKKNTNKRYNPYKTKEKLEQEEEFDEPELLGKNPNEMEVSEVNNNVEDIKQEADIVENSEPSTPFEEKPYYHSEELELEASRQKMILQLFSVYEVIMMIFVILFIFICITGKSKNDNLAMKWFAYNKEFFMDEYAHIGTDNHFNVESPLLKESYNNFKFYASGRVNLNYTLISIDLIKRQDLVSQATSLVLPTEKDRIIYEVSINSSDIPHVFCICKKKDIKFMKKTYNDIDFMTKINKDSFFEDRIKNMMFFSEDDEISDKLFDKTIRNLYEKIEKYIDIIYFTDRQTYSKEKYMLFCSFYVDSMKDCSNLTKFVHTLVDKLANLDFSSKKLAQAERLRKDFDEFIDKENQKKLNTDEKEVERKAQESKKKSESLTKKVLTKEQMQKLEEKERKEKIKKQKQKQIKIMKK